MHRLSARQKFLRVGLIVAVALVGMAVTPTEWKVVALFPCWLWVRLALARWVAYERRCPVCGGSGLAWRGRGRQHLVCARCGGYGTVDVHSGRRVWGVGMRGEWSPDGKR